MGLTLGLAACGGWRPGAGRKAGPNPAVHHRSRTFESPRFPHHVTLKVREDVPSLRSVRLVRELERGLRAVGARGRFRVVHYSIQTDHVHLIVEASSSEDLGRGMKAVGARLARGVNRVFARRGPVLRDRYHARTLRTPREVRNAISYVLLNARRHLAKRAGSIPRVACIDPASSGRWFDGWRGGWRPAADAPAVARPRTWLLGKGWREAGLVDPSEVPGCAIPGDWNSRERGKPLLLPNRPFLLCPAASHSARAPSMASG